MSRAAAFSVLALVLGACGGSGAMELHARAALASREALEAAHALIRDGRLEDQERAVRAATGQAEAALSVEAIRSRWQPAVLAYDAAAEAHDAWVSVLMTAEYSESLEAALPALGPVALEFVEAWEALSRAAVELGLEMPGPPAILVQLKDRLREIM